MDTPLHLAAINGDLETVEMILDKSAEINAKNHRGRTPLHNATEHKQIAELLLKNGADVNALDNAESTPLHSAAKNKQEDVAKLLISYGADINAQDKIGKTPLLCVVKNEWIEIVEDLVQHYVDMNAIDNWETTALHFTAVSDLFNENNGEQVRTELAKLLLKKGANVNSQTKNGETTLHLAIKKGYTKVVEALLEYDADVNCEMKPDITPLHLSAHKGNEEITKMLLLRGANVNAKQKFGTSALHIATTKGHKGVIEVLLDFGADVNSKMKSGITPFYISAREGNETITKMLLNKGADVNAKQIYTGTTALHLASKKGSIEIVKILLEYGTNVVSKRKRDITPLHFGVQHDREIFETILNFGVDINSRDGYGKTALHLASEYKKAKVVETLLEYGFDINATSKNNKTPLELAIGRMYYHNAFVYHCVKVLSCHIAKMIAANLFVSEKNLQLFGRIRRRMENVLENCKEEIVNMKSEKINNTNVSFYDILAKDVISLAICMRNKNIVHALKSAVYETKFPVYASMIKSHFRKGMESKEFLKQSNKIFRFFSPELPDHCIEKIFSYLSDKDLRIFITAYKEVARVNLKLTLLI